MGSYISIGGGLATSDANTQEDLLNSWPVTYADTVFMAMMGTSLLPFIGTISEVFSPPRSAGLHFYFADGMRDAFIRLINSKSVQPKALTSMSMRPRSSNPMVPDNPAADPSAAWRSIAAANGIGTSFRQADTGTSLHVAYNRASCDVHIDRNGFVIRDANGNVYWDLNGLLRHVTVDLLGDKAPWLLVSGGVLDAEKRPIFQATLSPWTAVDLPSKENGGRIELKIGLMIGGKFDETAIVNRLRR